MLLKYEENILCCLAALLWHIHPFDAVSVDVVIEGGMCSADVSLLFLGCIYDHFAAFPLSWNTHTHNKHGLKNCRWNLHNLVGYRILTVLHSWNLSSCCLSQDFLLPSLSLSYFHCLSEVCL